MNSKWVDAQHKEDQDYVERWRLNNDLENGRETKMSKEFRQLTAKEVESLNTRSRYWYTAGGQACKIYFMRSIAGFNREPLHIFGFDLQGKDGRRRSNKFVYEIFTNAQVILNIGKLLPDKEKARVKKLLDKSAIARAEDKARITRAFPVTTSIIEKANAPEILGWTSDGLRRIDTEGPT